MQTRPPLSFKRLQKISACTKDLSSHFDTCQLKLELSYFTFSRLASEIVCPLYNDSVTSFKLKSHFYEPSQILKNLHALSLKVFSSTSNVKTFSKKVHICAKKRRKISSIQKFHDRMVKQNFCGGSIDNWELLDEIINGKRLFCTKSFFEISESDRGSIKRLYARLVP